MAEKQKRPTKPHFFQPLLPGFQHQLSVPVSFYLQHLKGENPEKAVLRSPINGKLWHVKMKGRLIEDGWQEFSEEHELHVGDFCVFRYDGGFVFDVLVFDPSSCQREYSSFTVKQTPPEVKEEDIAGEEDEDEGSPRNMPKQRKT
ncbi:B3 domain-containing protein REM9-like [Euphorbia lathyris]|uniref:B3 domain-containing protein REM9-like n=1 Tax=Euphorbia lathyris TaxID=212925 RepID=UPI0033136028